MGWFSNPNKDGTPQSTSNDPLRDLDPSLRDFLEKESPVKYVTSPPPPPPPAHPSAQEQSSLSPIALSEHPNLVPPQSLYPDGRYAHLWKNYTPLSDIESASKTDQEKLLDILEGYKQRKAEIARAALENCALEQGAVNECFTNGSWASRMTMCRAENKQFERCYLMQSRFLKALGYLTTYDRPAAVDEEIQMHADTLFHRMLTQERAISDAKAANVPVPSFPPIIATSTSAATSSTRTRPMGAPQTTSEQEDTHDRLNPEARAALNEKLKKLGPEERELEERAVAMEAKAGEVLGRQIGDIYEERGRARRERRAAGKASLGDTVSGWFGW